MTLSNFDPKMLAALLFFGGASWAMGPAASLTGLATGDEESAAMVVATLPADETRVPDDGAGQQTAVSRFFTAAMHIDLTASRTTSDVDRRLDQERS